MSSPNHGLFIIGHGTKSNVGIEQFCNLVNQVAEKTSLPTGYGFIELAPPEISTGLKSLVSRHHLDKVTVVPLLLLAAGHVKNDIPAALADARATYPDIRFDCTRDISITTQLLEIIEQRTLEPFAHTGLFQPKHVVLVGRGSTDPDANSDLYKIARLLTERGKIGEVHPAFVSLALPSVTDTLERLCKLGATQIGVAPYFLFAGALLERIYTESRAWHLNHPEIDLALAAEMGPDPRIADLLISKVFTPDNQMMNCDMCVYRHPFPGHEHRVSLAIQDRISSKSIPGPDSP